MQLTRGGKSVLMCTHILLHGDIPGRYTAKEEQQLPKVKVDVWVWGSGPYHHHHQPEAKCGESEEGHLSREIVDGGRANEAVCSGRGGYDASEEEGPDGSHTEEEEEEEPPWAEPS